MALIPLRGNLVAKPRFEAGKDPETDRVNFKIAENRRDSKGNDLDALFHECVAWGQAARNIRDSEVLDRGVYVMVEGQLTYRKREVIDPKTDEKFKLDIAQFRVAEILLGTRYRTIDALTANEFEDGGSKSRPARSTRSRDEDEAPRGRARGRAAESEDAGDDAPEAETEEKELATAGASRGRGRASGRGRARGGSEGDRGGW